MPKGWHELGALPTGAKLLDEYGEVASRWRAALDAGIEPPATWVLDRKHFRRAKDEVLPPGHRVHEIVADRAPVRRASKAARAFVRLRAAAETLSLPEWPPDTEKLVLWASPVVRPRGVQVPALVHQLQVEPDAEAARGAIGELWATTYLEQALREIGARGVKRVEIVVGLTILTPASAQEARAEVTPVVAWAPEGSEAPEEDAPQPAGAGPATWTVLLADQEPTPTGFPLPGASKDCAPLSPLGRSFAVHGARAWQAVVRRRWGRRAASLVELGPGRWQWRADAVLRLLEQGAGLDERLLRSLTGLPVEERLGRERRWSARGALLGARELVHQGGLFETVTEHERHCREVLAGLRELDLAVLPDDGLKRTLEDARALETRTAELLAQATFSAEALVAFCEEAAPSSGPLVDAGLDALPWVSLLAEWEERLEVVRNDADCRRALEGPARRGDWTALPEGPGRRALRGLAESHGFFARRPEDPACPRLGEGRGQLVELAAFSLRGAGDVFGRCRAARFAADRALAAVETARGHVFAFAFGALRGMARDAILLRERVRLLDLQVGALLRRIAVDVDRRLHRLEPGLPEGAAFDCTVEELLEVVDLRGSSLAARVVWRRAQRERQRRHLEPWYPSVGARGGAGARTASSPPAGLPLGGAEDRGRAAVRPSRSTGTEGPVEGQAEGQVERRAESPVRVESLDGLWLLRVAYVPGILTRWAHRGDSVAVLARALGVPFASTSGAELRASTADHGGAPTTGAASRQTAHERETVGGQ